MGASNMSKNVALSEKLEKELMGITKKESIIDAIKELVRRELIRKKNKYSFIIKDFDKKYKMTFDEFEGQCKIKMNNEIEKDYLDWDMAVTALEDIEEGLKEIERSGTQKIFVKPCWKSQQHIK